MLIAILDLRTSPSDRAHVLAQLDDEKAAITEMPGNVAYRVYASRDDNDSVVVLHKWADVSSFAAYVSSDSFGRSGEIIRPLLTAPPVSRRFEATLLETV